MRVANNTGSPIFLKDGTQVGAAYTETAIVDVDELGEADRRLYVDRPDPILTILDGKPVVVKATTPTLELGKDDASRQDSRPTSIKSR
jgi:hypothetical protein